MRDKQTLWIVLHYTWYMNSKIILSVRVMNFVFKKNINNSANDSGESFFREKLPINLDDPEKNK